MTLEVQVSRDISLHFLSLHASSHTQTTRKRTTHNTFFVMPYQRDAKLTASFNAFQRRPALIAARVVRLQDHQPRRECSEKLAYRREPMVADGEGTTQPSEARPS